MSENTVWNLLKDLEQKKGITEVVINDPKRIFVERNGQFIQLNLQVTKNDLYEFAREVAQFNKREFDAYHPVLDGILPDGSRINVISEPFSQGSPAITIRKYLKSIRHFDDDETIFGLNGRWIELLKAMVSARCNIMVSGGTGVGKTTLINLLLQEISPVERVVTIEDTIELSLNNPNVVRLETFEKSSASTGLTARDLVKNTLRMRPDRIIVGEVRGAEIFDLLQAMNTGHEGSITSIHASSPAECMSRMENLFLMAGFEIPYQVVRRQIAQGVDFIIQLGRNREGKRELTSIMELTGMEGPNILSHQLIVREDRGLVTTGISPKRMEHLHRHGGLPMDFFNEA